MFTVNLPTNEPQFRALGQLKMRHVAPVNAAVGWRTCGINLRRSIHNGEFHMVTKLIFVSRDIDGSHVGEQCHVGQLCKLHTTTRE